MNSWSFIGRIVADAETKHIPSGDAIVEFRCAVDSGFGKNKTTTWVRCNFWGKRGEAVAPYLLKGSQVGIVGELANREYVTKEGQKQFSLEVRVNELTLVGGKKDDSAPSKPAPKPASNGDFESDIPF